MNTLNLALVAVDIHDPARIGESREDFLEGMDLAGEEGFEDWLRDERQSINAVREASREGNAQPELYFGTGSHAAKR